MTAQMRLLGFYDISRAHFHAKGVISPCIYWSRERNAICVRHGDDFILLAGRATHTWFLKATNEHMITKHLGSLGPSKDLGDVQEIRCLNRLIR